MAGEHSRFLQRQEFSVMDVWEEPDSSKTGVFCFMAFLTNSGVLMLVFLEE